MEGHAPKCVERYCELANKKTEQLYKVSRPCLDDHQSFKRRNTNDTCVGDEQEGSRATKKGLDSVCKSEGAQGALNHVADGGLEEQILK